MQIKTVLAGSVDVECVIRIIDATDGTPETGVVFNTAGIDIEYRRDGAASTDITEVTQTVGGAHTDGGFVHIGNGYYRVDLPDAAVAAGAAGVLVHGTVTGMVVIGAYINLVAYNPQDATRLGLTALPNANAGANTGLPVVGSQVPNANAGANNGLPTVGAQVPNANAGANGGLPTIDANLRVSANVTAMAADVLTNTALAASATNEIRDAIVSNGPIDASRLDVAVSTRLAAAGYTAPDNASIAAILGAVDTEVGASLTLLQRFDSMIELDGAVYRFTVNALEQAPAGGGGGAPTAVEIRQEMDANSTRLAAIETDTQDIQTRLPGALVGGRMDSNVGAVNNVQVQGNGTLGNEWRPV